MPDDEHGRSSANPEPPGEPKEIDEEPDDAEGQALTWKVRNPIPEVAEDAEDAEGHSVRPPPDQALPGLPALEDDDDASGHGGSSGLPVPPVD